MLPSANNLASVVRDALLQQVAPSSSADIRQLLLGPVTSTLSEILFRDGEGRQRLVDVYDALRGLAKDHNQLVRDVGRPAACVEIDGETRSQAGFDELVGLIDGLRGDLLAQAPSIMAALEDAEVADEWRARARAYLTSLLLNEQEELNRAPSTPDAGEARADRLGGAGRDLLRDVMRDRLGDAGLEIVEHTRLSGGFSRDTYLINAVHHGEPTKFVVRAAVVGAGFMDGIHRSIEEEFPILDLAWRSGVPVARPYFLETDHSILGSSFVLMAFSRGSAIGTVTAAATQAGADLFRTLAATLAAIHSLPWQANLEAFPSAGGRTDLTNEDAARMFLARNVRWGEEAGLRPSVALTLTHDWLAKNIPPNRKPTRASHGDIGFHNMMLSDAEISAVLDWEACNLCSPAWDLIAASQMLDDRVSWETFTAWYVEAGGELPDEAELNYYRVMRSFVGNVCCAVALERMFRQSGNISYIELGLMFRPYFQGQAVANLPTMIGG